MLEPRIARTTRWAVEHEGVFLWNEASGATLKLGYPEAAIWDLLTRRDSRARIATKLTVIASLAPETAATAVSNMVRRLVAEGFLECEEFPDG